MYTAPGRYNPHEPTSSVIERFRSWVWPQPQFERTRNAFKMHPAIFTRPARPLMASNSLAMSCCLDNTFRWGVLLHIGPSFTKWYLDGTNLPNHQNQKMPHVTLLVLLEQPGLFQSLCLWIYGAKPCWGPDWRGSGLLTATFGLAALQSKPGLAWISMCCPRRCGAFASISPRMKAIMKFPDAWLWFLRVNHHAVDYCSAFPMEKQLCVRK